MAALLTDAQPPAAAQKRAARHEDLATLAAKFSRAATVLTAYMLTWPLGRPAVSDISQPIKKTMTVIAMNHNQDELALCDLCINGIYHYSYMEYARMRMRMMKMMMMMMRMFHMMPRCLLRHCFCRHSGRCAFGSRSLARKDPRKQTRANPIFSFQPEAVEIFPKTTSQPFTFLSRPAAADTWIPCLQSNHNRRLLAVRLRWSSSLLAGSFAWGLSGALCRALGLAFGGRRRRLLNIHYWQCTRNLFLTFPSTFQKKSRATWGFLVLWVWAHPT